MKSTFVSHSKSVNNTRPGPWPPDTSGVRSSTCAAAPGLDAYERKAVAFPNAEHDDMVGAAVYAAGINGVGNDFYFTSANR